MLINQGTKPITYLYYLIAANFRLSPYLTEPTPLQNKIRLVDTGPGRLHAYEIFCNMETRCFQNGFDFDLEDYKPENTVDYEGNSTSLAVSFIFKIIVFYPLMTRKLVVIG